MWPKPRCKQGSCFAVLHRTMGIDWIRLTAVNARQALKGKHLLSLSGGDIWPSHGVSFSSRFWLGPSESSQVFSKNILDVSIGQYTDLRVGMMPVEPFLVTPCPLRQETVFTGNTLELFSLSNSLVLACRLQVGGGIWFSRTDDAPACSVCRNISGYSAEDCYR